MTGPKISSFTQVMSSVHWSAVAGMAGVAGWEVDERDGLATWLTGAMTSSGEVYREHMVTWSSLPSAWGRWGHRALLHTELWPPGGDTEHLRRSTKTTFTGTVSQPHWCFKPRRTDKLLPKQLCFDFYAFSGQIRNLGWKSTATLFFFCISLSASAAFITKINLVCILIHLISDTISEYVYILTLWLVLYQNVIFLAHSVVSFCEIMYKKILNKIIKGSLADRLPIFLMWHTSDTVEAWLAQKLPAQQTSQQRQHGNAHKEKKNVFTSQHNFCE